MKLILATALTVLCLPLITACAAAQPPNDVSPLLTPIIQKRDDPGMAAAVIRKGEIVAVGVAGVRTRGKPDTAGRSVLKLADAIANDAFLQAFGQLALEECPRLVLAHPQVFAAHRRLPGVFHVVLGGSLGGSHRVVAGQNLGRRDDNLTLEVWSLRTGPSCLGESGLAVRRQFLKVQGMEYLPTECGKTQEVLLVIFLLPTIWFASLGTIQAART
jgi:hypothetical protein